ncbi:hypothetical protein ACQ4PT_067761 [Festuca glaucescens]
MRRTNTRHLGPRRRAGETSRSGGEAADRLSALPDALLHHIMRDGAPSELRDFVNCLLLFRDVSAPVVTLCLRSSDEDDEAFDDDDADTWIMAALKRMAQVIHVVGHRKFPAPLDGVSFVSCHLRVLKLSYARLDCTILRQLSSACASLEELDLKDCVVAGTGIESASLKTLIMLKCTINLDFSVAAPNLVLLRLVTPYVRVPSFENLKSLIALHGYKDKYGYGGDIDRDGTTYKYSDIASGYLGDGQNFSKEGNYHDYGENDGCNYSTVLGGCNILDSLSSATSLELLADAGEVVLSRELKRCPAFINLKTMALGEWCMATDFDALIFLLQHSPNIERLFLHLKLNFNSREPSKTGIELAERSFTCNHVRIVKIKCSKDDVRVHMLAHLFMANGISLEKIYVCRSGSAYLRDQQSMNDLAKHELDFWGEPSGQSPVRCWRRWSCFSPGVWRWGAGPSPPATVLLGSGGSTAARVFGQRSNGRRAGDGAAAWRRGAKVARGEALSAQSQALGGPSGAGRAGLGRRRTASSRQGRWPELSGAKEEQGRSSPAAADQDLAAVTPVVAPSSDLHVFTFAELSAAIEGFAFGNYIGAGEFGTVYRGFLEDGVRPGLPTQHVAVKRSRDLDYRIEILLKEAMFLAQVQLRHPCLVKMIGYCYERPNRLLVYEFMAHGSLDNYLSKCTHSVMPWSTRLSIALATAKALASLHGEKKPLICGDFKASNILLDSDNNAKLLDLKLVRDERDNYYCDLGSLPIIGVRRCTTPEKFMFPPLTTKIDMYNFGMVLAQIMDPALKGIYPVEAAQKVALLTCNCLQIKPMERPDMSSVVQELELLTSAPFVADKDRLSSPVASNCDLHAFTYAELRAATGGFASRNIIGEGGFGAVYMGSLEDGARPGLVAQAVAVKRGLVSDYVEEMLKEAMFLAQVQQRHPSLVKMIGYCYHGNQRLLVYEFMGHGSLDNYLSKPTRSVLPWSTRLSIALATAKGLASLHGEEKPLICGKFNASDILLDSNNDVKISLSDLRLNMRSFDGTEITTRVGRSLRGCAPEYIILGHLTTKSVVYNFGVVLLEILITGKKSVDFTRPAKKRHLVDYARPCLKDPRRLARIMDRALKGIYPVAATQKMALLAYKCLRANPKRRPDMSAVVEALDQVTAIAVVEETPMIV